MTRPVDLTYTVCSRCKTSTGDFLIYSVNDLPVCAHCLTPEDDYKGRHSDPIELVAELATVVNNALRILKEGLSLWVQESDGNLDTVAILQKKDSDRKYKIKSAIDELKKVAA